MFAMVIISELIMLFSAPNEVETKANPIVQRETNLFIFILALSNGPYNERFTCERGRKAWRFWGYLLILICPSRFHFQHFSILIANHEDIEGFPPIQKEDIPFSDS